MPYKTPDQVIREVSKKVFLKQFFDRLKKETTDDGKYKILDKLYTIGYSVGYKAGFSDLEEEDEEDE